MEHQTYIKDCICPNSGIILHEGKPVCRWCRTPYANGGLMNYDQEHFRTGEPPEALIAGSPVHVISPQGHKINGMLKAFHSGGKAYAFVVYHCDGNWDNYADYTGVLTDTRDIKQGWVLEQGTTGRIKYISEAFSQQSATMLVMKVAEDAIKTLTNHQLQEGIQKILLERLVVGHKNGDPVEELLYCGYNFRGQRLFQFIHNSVNVGYFPESTI